MTSTADPCRLKSQYNFAIDEIHFIDLLDKALQKYGITGMHYITDTSRNGQINERSDCSNWCNIKGAGLGMRPTTDVASLGLSNLDALVWVKTPGESDGTSDQQAKRHDQHCNSQDSFIPAPEAGQFSDAIYDMLVKNANPPLSPAEEESVRALYEKSSKAQSVKQWEEFMNQWRQNEEQIYMSQGRNMPMQN